MSDQNAPDVVVEEPQVQTVALTGPWAQDVQGAFEDPAVQAQVDAFLREKVQPHVTRLEQETAGLASAKALYEDLTSNPGETFLAISQELFGDEAVDKIINALEAGDVTVTEDVDGALDLTTNSPDPEVQEAVQYYQQEKQRKMYDAALADFKEKHPDLEVDLFHPFVAGAHGDLEAAYAGYQKFVSDWKEKFGTAPELTPDEVPDPPTTLGGSSAPAVTAPPTEPKAQSLHDAIDDFFTTSRSSAPPTVGGV